MSNHVGTPVASSGFAILISIHSGMGSGSTSIPRLLRIRVHPTAIPVVLRRLKYSRWCAILDPMECNTRTHHSNMDVHDCVQPGDLMQGAAIMATFV